MYITYTDLRIKTKSKKENYTNIDLANSTNQIIQLINSLNLTRDMLPMVANNPSSLTNQSVSETGGTVIDTSGNIIINSIPSQPNHAVTLSYMNNYLYPGSNIMNSLLSDTITTKVLDMNRVDIDTVVQNVLADGAYPISNTTSIYGGGWRYVNNPTAYPGIINPSTSTSNKINWYFFNNSVNNSSYAYSRFNTAFMRLQFNSTSSVSEGNCPFLTIYTLPQASGNGSSLYRSKKSYLNQSSTPIINTDVVLYIGSDPRLRGFTNLNASQYVQLTYTNRDVSFIGPSGQIDIQSNEVISMLEWGTNSSSYVNVDFTCVEMGYSIGSSLNKFITFM